MFCEKCGAKMEDNAVACPSCGTPSAGGSASKAPVTGGQVAPTGEKVSNHMVGAILTTLFCCLIGGIIAIIYSSQVNSKLAQGDIEGAKSASKTALTWIIVNLVFGLLYVLITVIVLAAIAIPNYSKYRNESQATACISNMKMIQAAAEQYMMSHSSPPTRVSDLCGYDKYIKTEPTCPKDGSRYVIEYGYYSGCDVKCKSGDPRHVLR